MRMRVPLCASVRTPVRVCVCTCTVVVVGRARGVRRGSMRAGGAGEGGRRGGGRGWPKGTPLWVEGDGRKPRAHVATFECSRIWRACGAHASFRGCVLTNFWCILIVFSFGIWLYFVFIEFVNGVVTLNLVNIGFCSVREGF